MMPENIAAVDLDSAEHYVWGGVCDGWHLLKHPALSVIQERVPPHAGEVKHYHLHARQFFYVLSGSAMLELGGQQVLLNPGYFINGLASQEQVRDLPRAVESEEARR